MQGKKNKNYALSNSRNGNRELAKELQVGLLCKYSFLWVLVQRKGGELARCTPRAVEALTPTCSPISLWEEAVTVWPQMGHHVPNEVKKKMLLRFITSWWPSVLMCYKENLDHSLSILSKRLLYSGQGNSEQRLSNDDPSLTWKSQANWKVASIIKQIIQTDSRPGSIA